MVLTTGYKLPGARDHRPTSGARVKEAAQFGVNSCCTMKFFQKVHFTKMVGSAFTTIKESALYNPFAQCANMHSIPFQQLNAGSSHITFPPLVLHSAAQ